MGEYKMSQSNEAKDYKIFSMETSTKFPEENNILDNANIIKFNDDTNNLETKDTKTFNEMTYSFLKRTVDITASAAALLLLSPVFLATTLAIRKDSEGPAMFTQKRIGKDGKLFEIYKFRTMVPDADKKLFELLATDEDAAKEYKLNKKLKNDPRITKVGIFLRKTSIDELPQLINVLKGDMSLVGPRPYLPREIDDMGDYYNTIVESKPGITGLWQVSGRSNTTFQERLIFDEEYNENKSFMYDMGLLVKTVGSVAKGEGAE
jgi:undecaprenyl-phosphate galactose phosphotransferase